MLKALTSFGCLLLVAMPAGAAPGASKADLFGPRPTLEYVDISPDGNSVVYIAPGPGKSSVAYVASLAGGDPKPVITSNAEPDRLTWCDFVGNTRLICQIYGVVDLQGTLVPATRLFAIDTTGGNVKPLGQRQSFYDSRIRQFDGDILDWLPGDGTSVLMSREYVPEAGKIGSHIVRTKNGLGVDKIDVNTLKSSVVEGAIRNASGFMTDGRGHVRMMEATHMQGSTGQLSPIRAFYYRPDDSSDWKDFSTYDSSTREGMLPLAIDADLDAAYVLKRLNGRDALYRVKLDGSMATDLVYANDKVDVDDVVRIGRGQRVIGVTFAEEERHAIYFDTEFKKLATALGKALPNLPLIQFAGASGDGSKLLIFAGSDSDPGRYYVYDKAKRTLNEIMLVRPALENVALANVKPVSYPASDGTSIPAYLTLPPGKESAKNLPAIVLPHGGPSARDEWGFNWLAQFLASKGYAVLQPNYRGSAGYGEAWLVQNGFKNWRTSIGDVTSGAKWLVSQGIADPSKLAIVGWSYGGYAALQSAVTEPSLFKAVVAIAPVTDLALVKQEAREYTNASIVADFIGSGPHVEEGSPLQNVDRITAPVLLFHGDRDLNVDVEQSKEMDEALRQAGKQSQLVLYPGLEHSLDDSTARTDMLTKIAAFLSAKLGT